MVTDGEACHGLTMSTRTITLDERLSAFVRDHAISREPAVLGRLREKTSGLEMAKMQISVEQGRLMAILTMMLGAKRALEVGVFTGYSALCVAQHLPADGTLVACDVSKEWTSLAKPFWDEAGVSDRIDLRVGPAQDTLQAMIDGGDGGYDLAFIDADKTSYPTYYEQCLALLRPGGAIAIDNVFWSGSVADPARDDEVPTILRQLTDRVFADERVDACHVPIGDGVLLARKR